MRNAISFLTVLLCAAFVGSSLAQEKKLTSAKAKAAFDRADKALNAVGGGSLTRMGGSAKLAGHHMQNLVFQLNDVVVGLFSGLLMRRRRA